MNEFPHVGLIMIPFDNKDFFLRAAESVLENTDYPDFELFASHNPCKDKKINKEILEIMDSLYEKYPNFKYKINEKNFYHGKGSMKGFAFLPPNTKYVGLLNDDIFIPGNQLDWLKKMVKFIEEHDEAASVTPALYHLKETVYWMGREKDSGTHDYLHYKRGDDRLPKGAFKTSYNNMACCLTRYSLLEEFPLGQNCPHYGSDSEYADRIKMKYPEMNHWVLPQIKLYHSNIFYLRSNRGEDPITEG